MTKETKQIKEIVVKKKPNLRKLVLESSLKKRISPTTLQICLNIGENDKDKTYRALVREVIDIIMAADRKEQTQIFKDLIKISEAI